MRNGMFSHKVDDDVELRLFVGRDAGPLFALTDQNREHLRPYLPWVDHTRSMLDTSDFIRSSLQQFANDNGFQAGIWYQGKIVGAIGFLYWNWVNRKTEIGYWLAAEYQGHGIMTRACRALVDYAFDVLEMHRVEIQCAEPNQRSRAVPERLGFTQDGILRGAEWLHDHWENLVVYGVLRDEWHRSSELSKGV
jgi:ribosomal-protein-serine acetyltransferase